MENREQQILSEIRQMMDSIKGQIEMMEAKLAELQQVVGYEDADQVPIDLDIDDDLPFYEVPASVEEPIDATEPVEEPALEPETVEMEVEVVAEPEPVVEVEEHAVKVKQAVIDSMTDRNAWRKDMPGSQVRDIRSAISLNDRILFINWLFGEDPMAFQDALTKINQMSTLDEAVAFLADAYPQWDMESDVVYRFMMAVRRKVNQ